MADKQQKAYLNPEHESGSPVYGIVMRSRPFVLLMALFLYIFIAPIIPGSLVNTALHTCIIIAAVNMAAGTRRHLVTGLVLGIPGMILMLLADATANRTLDWLSYPFLLALYLHVIRLMLMSVFRARKVTMDTIGMALCAYIMIGILWVLFYVPIATYRPESFSFPDTVTDPIFFGDLVYFSYVTLTTLGYGDVIPLTPLARGLAILEALTGVLFLAVLISRLVGAYRSERDDA